MKYKVVFPKDRNIPVFVVNNEAGEEEHLQALVEELFKHLFIGGFATTATQCLTGCLCQAQRGCTSRCT
jgi:hypothetical protein